MAATTLQAQQLQNAFELFNQHSEDLQQSYSALQRRVERLTAELSAARSGRLAELVEKERLGQHLGHLLETLPGAIVVLDGKGIVRESNSLAIALLNQPLLGCSWSSIVRREVQDGGCEDGNLQLRDGRWLSLDRRLLSNEPGEVLLLADITEKREISAMRQRQERLTAIGEMTARFAHQVRTPLASAMLYAAQLDRGSDKQRRVVKKISARLDDLGRMVNDMLGFAAGVRNAQESLGVRALLVEVQSSIAPQLGPNANISIDCSDANIEVAGNRDALKGAVLNLVNNALQACGGDGSVVLGAARHDDGIEIFVSDDGPGIAADAMPKLFEPFFTTRPQGTGLGLAVVRSVAEAHSGRVVVDSSDAGSRFSVFLPAADKASVELGND
ncbi:MAG: HAMP domain-containing histidine kinase [Gammaproteobacteria bacterium]|nr:HAMP domain-containing histidine kinase [Gammaproteobacteria bacterium]